MSDVEKYLSKIELIKTQKLLYATIFKLDKIKMLITSKDKVSKKEILEIIDGDLYEKNE